MFAKLMITKNFFTSVLVIFFDNKKMAKCEHCDWRKLHWKKGEKIYPGIDFFVFKIFTDC